MEQKPKTVTEKQSNNKVKQDDEFKYFMFGDLWL